MTSTNIIKYFLSLTLIFCISLQVAQAQSVTFRFGPPDGYKELQTTDSTIELYVDGQKRITDTNTSKTEIAYLKTDNGYKIINKLVGVDAKRNGNKVTSPVNDVLIGREVSFDLNSQGKIVEIEGYDTLLKEINKVVDPKMQAMFSKILEPELLKKKTITEWDGRIGDFIGKNVKEGEKWVSTSEYKLKNETLKYLITTVFTKVSAESVRIDFSYTTDKNNVAKIIKELNNDMVKNINISDFDSNSSSLTGSGYRILDPSTMLVKNEQISRSISAKVKTQDGVEHNTKRTETRDYKFEELK